MIEQITLNVRVVGVHESIRGTVTLIHHALKRLQPYGEGLRAVLIYNKWSTTQRMCASRSEGFSEQSGNSNYG
jgi:hypothetical protein